MLGHEMITKLFDYNYWANDRILACAANVSAEQWDAPIEHGRGSLHEILYHMLTVEWGWRNVCQHHTPPETGPTIEDLATVDALKAFKDDEQQATRDFLASMTENDLAATVTMKDREGNDHSMVPWEVLVHINHHSAQHRSEAAAVLTSYGQSPGDIDFIFFVEGSD